MAGKKKLKHVTVCLTLGDIWLQFMSSNLPWNWKNVLPLVLILVYWKRNQSSFLVSDPQSVNEERAKGMEDKVFYGLNFILLIGVCHNMKISREISKSHLDVNSGQHHKNLHGSGGSTLSIHSGQHNKKSSRKWWINLEYT